MTILLLDINWLFKDVHFGFNLFHRDLNYCLQHCKPASVSTEKQSHVSIEGFDIEEINFIIDNIATG